MRQDNAAQPRRLAAFALSVVLAGASGTLAAIGNLGFVEDAPISGFQGADLEMFQTNLNQALEKDADGGVRHWENAKSGSSGEIAVLQSFTHANKACRSTRIVNRSRGHMEATTRFVFCKQADGQWKVNPAAKPPQPADSPKPVEK